MNITQLIKKLLQIKQIRFVIAGGTGALLNLGLMYLFVNILEMNSRILENIASVLSLELSIIFSFIINRNWTWRHRIQNNKYSILRQLAYFHIAVGVSVLLRILIYPLIQYLHVNYLLNTAFGIVFGAIINYFSFDKLVFKTKK